MCLLIISGNNTLLCLEVGNCYTSLMSRFLPYIQNNTIDCNFKNYNCILKKTFTITSSSPLQIIFLQNIYQIMIHILLNSKHLTNFRNLWIIYCRPVSTCTIDVWYKNNNQLQLWLKRSDRGFKKTFQNCTVFIYLKQSKSVFLIKNFIYLFQN